VAIDITPLLSENSTIAEKKLVGEQFNIARRTHGFMYIKSPLISTQLVQEAFKQAKRFFNESTPEQKQSIGVGLHGGQCGYTLNNYRPTQKVTDFKEFFSIRGEKNQYSVPHEFVHGEDCWPHWLEDAQHFKSTMHSYTELMLKLSRAVLHGFALAVNKEETHFDSMFTEPVFGLRFIKYPALAAYPTENRETYLACAAHTDPAMVTLLLQEPGDDALQIQHKGEWITVPYVPDSFVVNTGVSMEVVTGGSFKATLHRVELTETNATKDRYSFPFFLHPNVDTIMDRMQFDDSVAVDHPMIGRPYGDYLRNRFVIEGTYVKINK
jgi:isopenicillin N synthase-like dioxygenase